MKQEPKQKCLMYISLFTVYVKLYSEAWLHASIFIMDVFQYLWRGARGLISRPDFKTQNRSKPWLNPEVQIPSYTQISYCSFCIMGELLLQLQIGHFGEYSVLTWTPDTCWSPSEDAKPHTTGSGVEGAARRLAASPGRDTAETINSIKKDSG